MIKVEKTPPIASLTLNDPDRRNALGHAMFDALDEAISSLGNDAAIHIVRLGGEGPAFCSGFDLAAAQSAPQLLGEFIMRLSQLIRSIRRLPQVVVAEVHGAAIAGGCAILSACDFVYVSPDATLGYPVHRIGVSPAVTIPTLQLAIGQGPDRALLMSGELLTGKQAYQLGLASHCSASSESLQVEVDRFCVGLAGKGHHALRVTKAWLNELDGSLVDKQFEDPATASVELAAGAEARGMLLNWNRR